jgi:nucleoside 2-deoxyribosyltransferase
VQHRIQTRGTRWAISEFRDDEPEGIEFEIDPAVEVQAFGGSVGMPDTAGIPRMFDCKAYFVVSQQDVMDATGAAGVPSDLRRSLERFRADFLYPDKAAFLIMRFGETAAHREIVEAVRHAVEPHGITAVRADDKQYHDDLLANVRTYLHGCAFGIAVFERIEQQEFSPNVSFEVGYMMALGKDVCLLKDRSLGTLPADLIGRICRPFDLFNLRAGMSTELGAWLRDRTSGTARVQPS